MVLGFYFHFIICLFSFCIALDLQHATEVYVDDNEPVNIVPLSTKVPNTPECQKNTAFLGSILNYVIKILNKNVKEQRHSVYLLGLLRHILDRNSKSYISKELVAVKMALKALEDIEKGNSRRRMDHGFGHKQSINPKGLLQKKSRCAEAMLKIIEMASHIYVKLMEGTIVCDIHAEESDINKPVEFNGNYVQPTAYNPVIPMNKIFYDMVADPVYYPPDMQIIGPVNAYGDINNPTNDYAYIPYDNTPEINEVNLIGSLTPNYPEITFDGSLNTDGSYPQFDNIKGTPENQYTFKEMYPNINQQNPYGPFIGNGEIEIPTNNYYDGYPQQPITQDVEPKDIKAFLESIKQVPNLYDPLYDNKNIFQRPYFKTIYKYNNVPYTKLIIETVKNMIPGYDLKHSPYLKWIYQKILANNNNKILPYLLGKYIYNPNSIDTPSPYLTSPTNTIPVHQQIPDIPTYDIPDGNVNKPIYPDGIIPEDSYVIGIGTEKPEQYHDFYIDPNNINFNNYLPDNNDPKYTIKHPKTPIYVPNTGETIKNPIHIHKLKPKQHSHKINNNDGIMEQYNPFTNNILINLPDNDNFDVNVTPEDPINQGIPQDNDSGIVPSIIIDEEEPKTNPYVDDVKIIKKINEFPTHNMFPNKNQEKDIKYHFGNVKFPPKYPYDVPWIPKPGQKQDNGFIFKGIEQNNSGYKIINKKTTKNTIKQENSTDIEENIEDQYNNVNDPNGKPVFEYNHVHHSQPNKIIHYPIVQYQPPNEKESCVYVYHNGKYIHLPKQYIPFSPLTSAYIAQVEKRMNEAEKNGLVYDEKHDHEINRHVKKYNDKRDEYLNNQNYDESDEDSSNQHSSQDDDDVPDCPTYPYDINDPEADGNEGWYEYVNPYNINPNEYANVYGAYKDNGILSQEKNKHPFKKQKLLLTDGNTDDLDGDKTPEKDDDMDTSTRLYGPDDFDSDEEQNSDEESYSEYVKDEANDVTMNQQNSQADESTKQNPEDENESNNKLDYSHSFPYINFQMHGYELPLNLNLLQYPNIKTGQDKNYRGIVPSESQFAYDYFDIDDKSAKKKKKIFNDSPYDQTKIQQDFSSNRYNKNPFGINAIYKAVQKTDAGFLASDYPNENSAYLEKRYKIAHQHQKNKNKIMSSYDGSTPNTQNLKFQKVHKKQNLNLALPVTSTTENKNNFIPFEIHLSQNDDDEIDVVKGKPKTKAPKKYIHEFKIESDPEIVNHEKYVVSNIESPPLEAEAMVTNYEDATHKPTYTAYLNSNHSHSGIPYEYMKAWNAYNKDISKAKNASNNYNILEAISPQQIPSFLEEYLTELNKANAIKRHQRPIGINGIQNDMIKPENVLSLTSSPHLINNVKSKLFGPVGTRIKHKIGGHKNKGGRPMTLLELHEKELKKKSDSNRYKKEPSLQVDNMKPSTRVRSSDSRFMTPDIPNVIRPPGHFSFIDPHHLMETIKNVNALSNNDIHTEGLSTDDDMTDYDSKEFESNTSTTTTPQEEYDQGDETEAVNELFNYYYPNDSEINNIVNEEKDLNNQLLKGAMLSSTIEELHDLPIEDHFEIDFKVIQLIKDIINEKERFISSDDDDPDMLKTIEHIKQLANKNNIEFAEYFELLQLYQRFVNYMKQFEVDDKTAELHDLITGTNQIKLNSSDVSNVLEMTYLVKSPKPVIYYPYYYVKYRLPHSQLYYHLEKLASNEPDIENERLKDEILKIANVAEASQDLKSINKEDILKLTLSGGDLISTRFINDVDTGLDTLLDSTKDLKADVDVEDIDKLNEDIKVDIYEINEKKKKSKAAMTWIGTVKDNNNLSTSKDKLLNMYVKEVVNKSKDDIHRDGEMSAHDNKPNLSEDRDNNTLKLSSEHMVRGYGYNLPDIYQIGYLSHKETKSPIEKLYKATELADKEKTITRKGHKFTKASNKIKNMQVNKITGGSQNSITGYKITTNKKKKNKKKEKTGPKDVIIYKDMGYDDHTDPQLHPDGDPNDYPSNYPQDGSNTNPNYDVDILPFDDPGPSPNPNYYPYDGDTPYNPNYNPYSPSPNPNPNYNPYNPNYNPYNPSPTPNPNYNPYNPNYNPYNPNHNPNPNFNPYDGTTPNPNYNPYNPHPSPNPNYNPYNPNPNPNLDPNYNPYDPNVTPNPNYDPNHNPNPNVNPYDGGSPNPNYNPYVPNVTPNPNYNPYDPNHNPNPNVNPYDGGSPNPNYNPHDLNLTPNPNYNPHNSATDNPDFKPPYFYDPNANPFNDPNYNPHNPTVYPHHDGDVIVMNGKNDNQGNNPNDPNIVNPTIINPGEANPIPVTPNPVYHNEGYPNQGYPNPAYPTPAYPNQGPLDPNQDPNIVTIGPHADQENPINMNHVNGNLVKRNPHPKVFYNDNSHLINNETNYNGNILENIEINNNYAPHKNEKGNDATKFNVKKTEAFAYYPLEMFNTTSGIEPMT